MFLSPNIIVFWEYNDELGNNPMWAPTSKQWTLGSRKVTLTELENLCKMSKDELTLLKLKYGG